MNSVVYAEVDYIVENLDKSYKDKIPEKLLQIIKKKKLKGYEPKIDVSKSLYGQNVERDTLVFLAMLYYNCWCEDNEEKESLLNILNLNSQYE